MIRPRCRSSGASRLFALALALLFLFGHAQSFAHFLLVQHHICAEHGELVHGASRGPLTLHRADDQRAVAPLASGEDGEDAHEHCALLALARDTAQITAPSLSGAIEPPAQLAEHVDLSTRTGFPALELRDLAPKTSPPLA